MGASGAAPEEQAAREKEAEVVAGSEEGSAVEARADADERLP